MSRNIHDVARHGTLMVKIDDSVPDVWNKLAGFDVGLIGGIDQYDLTPDQMTKIATVAESMSGYSDEDLESMARIGRRAQLALDARRSRVTSAQVEEACQPIMKR
ncbi:hypothetical protein MPK67_gp204 [Erwinia phage pEa_SNUABM_32]|uniref:Uncharacterized protein n=1 Tax=Erwinia phage pEa_SNUABM_32 TaxID=2869555 RepID=A0AAE7XKQ2_9CAUD|nr:hypothetical protein MPK67_gp204 [Erwinia phage pEa_SNUABM_32]QZE57077.1 hypothetical protein pEaSNUABM32_00204 [Erwinia phage pEa_SNUABM_32]